MKNKGSSKHRSLPGYLKDTFTWPNISWFLAQILSKSLLFVGSITSATGGFKAIPILLTLWPLNTIILPSIVITVLCCIAALSGFTAFWGNFSESLTHFIADCIKKISEKFGLTTKKPEIAAAFLLPSLTETDDPLREYIIARVLKEKENSDLYDQLKAHIDSLNPMMSDAERNKLKASLLRRYRTQTSLHPKATSSNTSVTPQSPKESTLKYISKKLWHGLVKAFSSLLVIFGCFVVVGMGVLTNQGFASYFGLAGSVVIALCILAAVIKQVDQMPFSVPKQYDTLCRMFGVETTTTSKPQLSLEAQKEYRSINHERSALKRANKINTKLKKFKAREIDPCLEKQAKLRDLRSSIIIEPIQFLHKRHSYFQVASTILRQDIAEELMTYKDELELLQAERRDTLLDFMDSVIKPA